MKRGRPNKSEQLQIERKLRPYFERMLSVSFAAKETGVNVNTVKKYYKTWSDEIKSTEHPDFIKRSKIIIRNSVLAIDHQLLKLYKLQETIEKQITHNIKQHNGIPDLSLGLYKVSILLSDKISDLILKKTNLTVTPTADVTLSNEVKDLLN